MVQYFLVYEAVYQRHGERGITTAFRAAKTTRRENHSHPPCSPENDRTQARPGNPGKCVQAREERQIGNDYSYICPLFHWAVLQALTTSHPEASAIRNHLSDYNVLEGKVMSMSWRPHQTTSRRKIITIQEWADYIGVSKNTILARLKKYRLLYEYDPRDIYSVFNFLKFLLQR